MGDKKIVGSSYQIIRFSGGKVPDTYKNFILSKWMRSYRYNNDYMMLVDSDCFFAAYRRYLLSILFDKRSAIRLAVLSDDHDVALGFSAICNESVLHYVYVHKDHRRTGIGKNLVPIEVKSFTHITKTGIRLWPTKVPEAIFNPFQ